MEITNLDSPDDGTIESLAGLCECCGTFLNGAVDGVDDEPETAADQARFY